MHRAVALVAALLLVGACGGEPAGGEPDDWRTLLVHLPSPHGDGPLILTVVDYEAARATLGLERPAEEAPPGQIAEYMVTLQRGPLAEGDTASAQHSPAMAASYSLFGGAASDVSQWRDTLGFSALDVDRIAVSFSTSFVTVFEGRIEPDAVAAALDASAGGVNSEAYQDASYVTWDGVVGPDSWHGGLTVEDGILVHANRMEDLHRAIDAARDTGSALAGIEEVRLAADAVTVPGVYGVSLLLWLDLAPAGEQLEAFASLSEVELLQRARDVERLFPYQAVAAAAGLEADQPYVVFSMVHPFTTAADVNAVLLEEFFTTGTSVYRQRPWSELVEITSLEVQGRVTAIRFDTSEPELFREMVDTLRYVNLLEVG